MIHGGVTLASLRFVERKQKEFFNEVHSRR